MSGVEHRYEVTARRQIWSGRIFSVVSDDVTMPGGGEATRDYVRHVGAVAVVALDDAGQVVLIRQYRHPVGRHLCELPAGLMDVGGEDLAAAALAQADQSWLTSLLTRRVPVSNYREAYARTGEDIKAVLDFTQ